MDKNMTILFTCTAYLWFEMKNFMFYFSQICRQINVCKDQMYLIQYT
jgi:hypothetical protein